MISDVADFKAAGLISDCADFKASGLISDGADFKPLEISFAPLDDAGLRKVTTWIFYVLICLTLLVEIHGKVNCVAQ